MYVVLILLFLFLVCDEMRAKRSLRKAMGIKQPVGKVRKIGKVIRETRERQKKGCKKSHAGCKKDNPGVTGRQTGIQGSDAGSPLGSA